MEGGECRGGEVEGRGGKGWDRTVEDRGVVWGSRWRGRVGPDSSPPCACPGTTSTTSQAPSMPTATRAAAACCTAVAAAPSTPRTPAVRTRPGGVTFFNSISLTHPACFARVEPSAQIRWRNRRKGDGRRRSRVIGGGAGFRRKTRTRTRTRRTTMALTLSQLTVLPSASYGSQLCLWHHVDTAHSV